MNKSENINELAAALSKFQGECSSTEKNKKNPFFKSNYADLAGYIQAANETLCKNGLAVMQLLSNNTEGKMVLETILSHSGGQFISSVVVIPANPQSLTDPQKAGSAITYMRRYAYAAILGMAAADDDGNSMAKQKKVAPVQVFMADKGWQNHVNSLIHQGLGLDSIIDSIQTEVKGLTLTLEDKNIIVSLINGSN